MKKSELKRHIIEALTPQEADKVDSKYKEIYGGMLKGNKKKLMKYIDPESGRPNPDKVAYGRAIKLIQKESANLKEKLGKDADLGDHIEDFQKSDAKQFQGKSKKKIKQMATAAFLNKEEQKLEEIDTIMEEDKIPVDKLEKKVKSILKKEGGAVGLKPLVDAAKELGASKKDLMDILKKMKDIKTHKDGDIIDVGGLNENARQAEKWMKMDPKMKKKQYPKFHNRKYNQLKSHEKAQIKETGMDKAKKNMDMYKDKNRLTELIKAALMGPVKETSTDKYDDNPALKGKQSELPDGLQKAIIKKSGGKVDEAELPGGVLTKLNQEVKDIPTMAKAMLSLYNQIKDKEQLDFSSNASMKIVLAKLQDLASKVKVKEDVVKGSNIKKVGDDWRVLSGKTGKMWKQKYDSKKDAEAALRGYFASQNESLAETILKELRGNINEMAGEDLELKSLAKKFIPILKKYQMGVQYLTDTSKFDVKRPEDKAHDVPALLVVKDGVLQVAVYFMSLAYAGGKKDELGDNPKTREVAEKEAAKLYKELIAVLPEGEFEFRSKPEMNRFGNYILQFRLKK